MASSCPTMAPRRPLGPSTQNSVSPRDIFEPSPEGATSEGSAASLGHPAPMQTSQACENDATRCKAP
eukprot:567371-Pyramimonas_sp.AAC.1